MEMRNELPCWLSPKDKAIAEALIESAGFIYCGREEDFISYDEELGTGYKLAVVLGWRLASAYGEVALLAVRDGAVFGKCLEVLPDIDFKKEVKLAKKIISPKRLKTGKSLKLPALLSWYCLSGTANRRRLTMNEQEIQKQIDERCPCFSKPLNECDCESDEQNSFYTKKLLRDAVVVQLPKPEERLIIPRKPPSFT